MHWLDIDADLARDSYYARTSPWPLVASEPAQPLDDLPVADVLVIGGGLAGLSVAIELADRGRQVVLLEAVRVGAGASGRNGGQVLPGLACDLEVIERQVGQQDAGRIWTMTLEALDVLAARRERFCIDDEWQPGYLLLADRSWRARKLKSLRRWVERMRQVHGHAMTWLGPADLPAHIDSPRFVGGALDPLAGHLHPLKHVQGLARAARSLGVRIVEGCPVLRLQPGAPAVAHTPRGRLRARHVVLAGNAALHALCSDLGEARVVRADGSMAASPAARIMPVGTYVVTTPVLPPGLLDGLLPTRSAVCDSNFVLDYFRPTADGRLMFGGGVSYSTRTPHRMAAGLQRRMAHTFPALAGTPVEHAWGGFVDITQNRAPDFARLGWPPHRGPVASVYLLQGFSGHGLALTALAGRLVAEALCGDSERFDVLARLQHRPFPGGAWLRTPALVLGMTWYRLRDLL